MFAVASTMPAASGVSLEEAAAGPMRLLMRRRGRRSAGTKILGEG
jgi:hypothetical protein